MPRDRCPYKSVWLFLEKICELFVGTNKTVGHSIRVFVERGSTVLFYVPFHLCTEKFFLSVCRIEGCKNGGCTVVFQCFMTFATGVE